MRMPREKFLTLEEAVEMVLADDSPEVTDVVLLPPPSADDILTDEEEGDSDIAVVGTLPNDVAAWRLYTEVGSQPPLDQLQFTRLIVQGLLTKRLDTRERPGPSGALVFHSK
ncbi:hypothetical protein MTO96_032975 [Rhipicephalus appendiculatus]